MVLLSLNYLFIHIYMSALVGMWPYNKTDYPLVSGSRNVSVNRTARCMVPAFLTPANDYRFTCTTLIRNGKRN
ncbi:MAG: hypothetical protein A4E34_02711 [Methanoregula sp. PtaU1.Bin006]|nr:MAG: hypothetical protein A4E33_00502 [Methanoregula sp. PtaB.Bin085]OPY32336.1 MAG: hypothetical protein A4E34_02711 [Methanoregula sp. PtaU1.Bin006]